jgi:IS605 OrfB family transposase
LQLFKIKRKYILFPVKRTIAIKLTLSEIERQALDRLEAKFSAACNDVGQVAFQAKERNRVKLHHLAYYSIREKFPELGAQMACNAIAKVAQALRALKRPKELLFKKGCSVHFDKRTYSLKGQNLSLFTLEKRLRLPLDISSFHKRFLEQGKAREAELVRKGKRWFFHLVLDLPDTPFIPSDRKIGVDFGENVLAALSTGKLLGGGPLRANRDQFLAHRQRLQSKGTQAAKQRLRKISGREKRAVRHTNHCVAKYIVSEARENGCGAIVLENLKNIRERIKAKKRERSRLHRWAFDQLRVFVEYKARESGIQTLYVCPAYTSKTCSHCLSLGSRIKHRFFCSLCGSLQHSDLNASRNLLRLGESADPSTGDVNRRHIAVTHGR